MAPVFRRNDLSAPHAGVAPAAGEIVQGEGDEHVASSQGASAAYHSAFDQFRLANTRLELEAAMVGLQAAQVVEQDARQLNMLRVAESMARCDLVLEESPQPNDADRWWAVVGLRADMDTAEADLKEGWIVEKRTRFVDLQHVAHAKAEEGLVCDDSQTDPLWAAIVTHAFNAAFDDQ